MEGISALYQQDWDSILNAPVSLDSLAVADDQKAAIQTIFHQTLMAVRDKETAAVNALPKDDPNEMFYAQSVPAYAATEGFNYLRQKFPEYTYKEATLNPTNLRDRVTEWEADIVNTFRNDSSREESCLECHSTPSAAPPAMLKAYGTANGFGWKLNETVGAQIVQVPKALPLKIADHAFNVLIVSLVGVFLFTLIVLNLALYFTLIQPLGIISAKADQVSAGKLDVEEFPVKGKDEISILANSFNRMQRSLIKAMEMLNE
jgi:protein-histidine pros-kinase